MGSFSFPKSVRGSAAWFKQRDIRSSYWGRITIQFIAMGHPVLPEESSEGIQEDFGGHKNRFWLLGAKQATLRSWLRAWPGRDCALVGKP